MARLRDKPESGTAGGFKPDPSFMPDPDSPVDPLIQELAAQLSLEDLLGVEGAAHWEAQKEEPVDNTEFFARLDQIWAGVTDEEWEAIPADMSVNLDHYLYGSPKRAK